MGLSRQEVNFRRLLAKCELMSKNRKEDDRIEKYVDTLEGMFQELKKLSDSHEKVNDYSRRIKTVKTLLGITSNKYEDETDPKMMRNNLLGLRQRTSPKSEDLDEVINYNENIHQKITEDMLFLTKSLKEQSETAQRVIKKDTEVVSRSAELTDKNFTNLTVESTKLSEHSKKAWKCWMWLMLAIVLIVFINMALFMKVMKKKY